MAGLNRNSKHNDAQLLAENERLRADITRLTEKVAQQAVDIADLERSLKLALKVRFSPSSERVSPGQLLLFPDQPIPKPPADQEDDGAVDVGSHKRKKRSPLPKNLPRLDPIMHDLPEDQRRCTVHGIDMSRAGEHTFERLRLIPAKAEIEVHKCARYCCELCETKGVIAPMPPAAIPGSIATPSLLATIAAGKYADGMPLYGQETQLRRYGVELTRTTMGTWMTKSAVLFVPLYNLLVDNLLAGPAIYIDETHLQVLKGTDKKPTSKSFMWVRVGGIENRPVVVFDFSVSRSADIAVRLLEDYRGFIHTDGYDGYIAAQSRPGIVRLQCWMHARRMFVKALKTLGKAGKDGIADQAIQRIRQLYKIEREARNRPPEEILQIRQEKSKPLLNAFQEWLQSVHPLVPEGGQTAKAIHYALSRWDDLTVFLSDGRLRPDNAPAENAIRPFAVGRRRWLFNDCIEGAEAAALHYTVVETAKACGIEPFAYYQILYERLPLASTFADIEALLPWACDLPRRSVTSPWLHETSDI